MLMSQIEVKQNTAKILTAKLFETQYCVGQKILTAKLLTHSIALDKDWG